ncbi:SMC-Scp complex subunit ScpB [Caviibacter abscessus]|uniref:SMC-Scp complex subunit ScpB n=1 Tax=Caviibacter abscessus TaxID=1766719 RepID=UPI0009EA98A3|nr:SMC-Scp complex subunit ScpB [Caviibacter abscessus]
MSDILKEIEAIIFLSGKKVNIEELANFYEITKEILLEHLKELQILMENTGINLVIKENTVYMSSNPLLGEMVSKYFNPEIRIKKLSKSSMETLTIIAYKGPITKGEIEEIKGVGVDNSISTLLEKKLIHSVGRKKALGSPKLYEVTNEFYGYLGFEDKEELYSLDKAQWLRSLDYTGEENNNED